MVRRARRRTEAGYYRRDRACLCRSPPTIPCSWSYIANRGGRPTGSSTGPVASSPTPPPSMPTAHVRRRRRSVVRGRDRLGRRPDPRRLRALACGATSVIFEGMLARPRIGGRGTASSDTGYDARDDALGASNLRHWPTADRGRASSTLSTLVTAGESSEPELRAWLTATCLGSGGSSRMRGDRQSSRIVNLTEASRGDALARPGS